MKKGDEITDKKLIAALRNYWPIVLNQIHTENSEFFKEEYISNHEYQNAVDITDREFMKQTGVMIVDRGRRTLKIHDISKLVLWRMAQL